MLNHNTALSFILLIVHEKIFACMCHGVFCFWLNLKLFLFVHFPDNMNKFLQSDIMFLYIL